MSKPHCCIYSDCRGEKFNGLSIKCSDCSGITFLECIAEYPGILNFITRFDVMKVNSGKEANLIQKSLDILFDKKSPLATLCMNCRHTKKLVNATDYSSLLSQIDSKKSSISAMSLKIFDLENEIRKMKQNDPNAETFFELSDDNSEVITSGVMNRFNNFKRKEDTSLNLNNFDIVDEIQKIHNEIADLKQCFNAKFIPSSTAIDEKIEQPEIAKKVVVRQLNGVYSLHISKFPKDYKPDDIVAMISGKTEINPDSYSVNYASKRKYKKNKFLNFKISTLKREICDLLLDSSIWSPNYVVKPFEEIKVDLKLNNIIKVDEIKTKSKDVKPIQNKPSISQSKSSSSVNKLVNDKKTNSHLSNESNKNHVQNGMTRRNNKLRSKSVNNSYQNKFAQRRPDVLPQYYQYPFWKMDFNQPSPHQDQFYHHQAPYYQNNVNSIPFIPPMSHSNMNYPMSIARPY